jgi:hypothetical protein
MEAANSPGERPVERGPVRQTYQAGDGSGGVSRQVFPGAVDPEQPEFRTEPEHRLASLLDELIEPASEDAGRRHEDDRLT